MADRSSLLLSTWSSEGKLNEIPSSPRKSSILPQIMFRRLFLVAGISRRITLNFPAIDFDPSATALFLTTFTRSGCSAMPEISESKWLLPVP